MSDQSKRPSVENRAARQARQQAAALKELELEADRRQAQSKRLRELREKAAENA